jgi:predicted Zn-dependent peptidase
MTEYYIHSSIKYRNEAIDLLSDIFCNSTFPKNEIEKEKKVILAELKLHQSKGSFRNNLLIKESYFGKDKPGGLCSLGNEENIQNMTQSALKKYVRDYYVASNIIVLLAGNFDEKETVDKIKTNLKSISCLKPKKKVKIKFLDHKQEIFTKKGNPFQSCLTVSFPILSVEKTQIGYINLLHNILIGKGFTSRIKRKIRCQGGFSYNPTCIFSTSSNHGFIFIKIPTASENILDCLKIILDELSDIKQGGVSKEELRESVINIGGKLDFEDDSFYHFAQSIAHQIAKKNEYLSLKDRFKQYKLITREELQAFANDLFDFNKIKICVSGTCDKKAMQKDIKKVLKKYTK